MRKVKINGIYKNFKGNRYIVLDIGYDSDTCERCVIYRGLYENGKIWIRKEDDFLSEVNHTKYPNVKQKYKFKLENIKSVVK